MVNEENKWRVFVYEMRLLRYGIIFAAALVSQCVCLATGAKGFAATGAVLSGLVLLWSLVMILVIRRREPQA
jgi:hypothetical protein